jgi:excisionase family DNA binding protein
MIQLQKTKTPSADTDPSSASSHAELQTASILTKQQTAQLLGCTVRFVERQISAGRLRACKATGKFVRIFRADIDRWLNDCGSVE